MKAPRSQIKSLLNKNIACEQLSNIGSVKMLCDELAKSKRDVYCVRDEFKKLLKLVNEKDYYQAKQRLQTIIENWEKLYNNPQ